jgi:hypothetical protein
MNSGGLINPNPTIYEVHAIRRGEDVKELELDDTSPDVFDTLEVFGA